MTSFKHLGATLCKDGTCSAKVNIRIAPAMAAMARLSRIWRCNTVSFASKFKLYKSHVTSILLYGCETWTLHADFKKGSRLKTKCLRKLLHIYYLSIGPRIGCGARSAPLWVQRNLFWQLSRDGNLHGLSMSHAMTASPKPSFRAPWRVGDTVVSRGNAGWTMSKSRHPC